MPDREPPPKGPGQPAGPTDPADPVGSGLGRAIRVLRSTRDLSRRQLAERAGLSYSFLSEIENGAKSPSTRALAALARGLGVAASALVEMAESWRRPLALGPGTPAQTTGNEDEEASFVAASADYLAYRDAAMDEAMDLAPGDAPRGAPMDRALRSLVLRRELRREVRLGLGPDESRAAASLPPPLLDDIRAGRCVAFLGAGFSAAARLPGWGELLARVAERGRAAARTRVHVAERVALGSAHALDEAAQVLEDELGRPRFLALLEELLGHPEVPEPMARRIEWLHGIPFRAILTTNFDGLLAGATPDRTAYREALRPDPARWWAPRYWHGGGGAFTLKLHGDLARLADAGDSVVLTRRDYRRRLYDDPAYETFLRAVMATTTVLYMGFSFEDAYLNELRSEILALLGQRQESAPVAYAIVNDVPPDTRHHFRRHEGIEILSYDTQGGRDFSGFDAMLEAIHEATNPLLRFARHLEQRRILWVDPHPENNDLAFAHLAHAARVSGREASALVTAPTADEGLRALAEAEDREPFDLAITHWGQDAARDDEGRAVPAAVRLLDGIRRRDLRCPVVVFAAERDVEARKRTALGLGAQAYCHSFEALYRAIERVLGPGEEAE